MFRLPCRKARGDGLDHIALRDHADLHRADREIDEHGIDLLAHELRRHLDGCR